MTETMRPEPPVAIIADGGASAGAPTHTIAALELALDEGADGIKVNVHLSRDNHPVVARDFALDRTTDGSGPVRERTVRDLKRLDAGGWFGRRFLGQRVQTLAEVFERFRDRTRFWVEIASHPDSHADAVERIVSTVEIYELEERVTIQCVDPTVLESVAVLNASLSVGLVVAEPPLDARIAVPGPAPALCPRIDLVTARALDQMRLAGLRSYVWNVDEPAQMDRLIEWGVTGVITDRPGRLRARLGR